MKPKVSPERRAYTIDIKAQDTALGERFVGRKRGLSGAPAQTRILFPGRDWLWAYHAPPRKWCTAVLIVASSGGLQVLKLLLIGE